MTIERIYGGLWIPAPVPFNTVVPAFVSMLMDATGEKVAFIIQAPKTGTLDKFEFRIGASLQLPTNGLKCSFQDVDLGTGDPDGTVDQYRVVTGLSADSWVIPGLVTSDGTDGGTKRSVARGDLLACVVEFQSFNLLDVVNVLALDISSTAFIGSPPYSDHSTVLWAKQTNGPILVLKYDDGTYEHITGGICYPIKDLVNTDFNGSSVTKLWGLAFSFPTDVLVGGVYVRMAAPTNATLTLYDKDGVFALEIVDLNSGVQVATTGHYHAIRFKKDHLLRANEVYRVGLNTTSFFTSITLYTFDTNGATLMNAVDGGQSFYLTNADSEFVPDWVDFPASRPWMGVIVTGVDHDISGGSGGPGWEGVP